MKSDDYKLIIFLVFVVLQSVSKPKTETKDDDSDVEFVSTSPPTTTVAAKTESTKKIGGNANGAVSITAIKRSISNSINDKRSTTSITQNKCNSNNNNNTNSSSSSGNKPVISARTVPPTVPTIRNPTTPVVLPNRLLTDVSIKIPTTMATDGNANTPKSQHTVKVVTRQADGTVILRKVQMAPKRPASTPSSMQRPLKPKPPVSANAPTTTEPLNASAAPKRMKISEPIVRAKILNPIQRTTMTPTTTTATSMKPAIITAVSNPTRSQRMPRIRTLTDAGKMAIRQRRIVAIAEHSPLPSIGGDAEKVMTPLSFSEHQYAKRNNNESGTIAAAGDMEKPSPQTPLSATEHHYSRLMTTQTAPRYRCRPTTATVTVVATAADSTRTDEIIRPAATTMAPSAASNKLLNELLYKIKPSIRVRSVNSLNGNNNINARTG